MVAIVTTGLGVLADVDMGMEIAVELEDEAGLGKICGCCLLAFDTLVTFVVVLTLAAG